MPNSLLAAPLQATMVPSRSTARAGSPIGKIILLVPKAIEACKRARIGAFTVISNGTAWPGSAGGQAYATTFIIRKPAVTDMIQVRDAEALLPDFCNWNRG